MKFYNKSDNNKVNKTNPNHFPVCLSRAGIGIFASLFPSTWHQCLAHSNCSVYNLVLFFEDSFLTSSITTDDKVINENIQRNRSRGCKGCLMVKDLETYRPSLHKADNNTVWVWTENSFLNLSQDLSIGEDILG